MWGLGRYGPGGPVIQGVSHCPARAWSTRPSGCEALSGTGPQRRSFRVCIARHGFGAPVIQSVHCPARVRSAGHSEYALPGTGPERPFSAADCLELTPHAKVHLLNLTHTTGSGLWAIARHVSGAPVVQGVGHCPARVRSADGSGCGPLPGTGPERRWFRVWALPGTGPQRRWFRMWGLARHGSGAPVIPGGRRLSPGPAFARPTRPGPGRCRRRWAARPGGSGA